MAPIVIRNRIQQRLTRKDLYFKAIQELLEIGDAYRVSRELSNMMRESDEDEGYEIISEDEEEEEDCFPFLTRLKQRKMSLAGILEQSAAERAGFAALLAHKLNMLLMEDEIECEASYVSNPARSSVESAPAWLPSGWEGGEGSFGDEESLTIFNESDLTSRGQSRLVFLAGPFYLIKMKKMSLLFLLYIFYPGWTSQLTTPCATPYLSVDSLSPRTMSSGWSGLSATTQHRSTSWLVVWSSDPRLLFQISQYYQQD